MKIGIRISNKYKRYAKMSDKMSTCARFTVLLVSVFKCCCVSHRCHRFYFIIFDFFFLGVSFCGRVESNPACTFTHHKWNFQRFIFATLLCKIYRWSIWMDDFKLDIAIVVCWLQFHKIYTFSLISSTITPSKTYKKNEK